MHKYARIIYKNSKNFFTSYEKCTKLEIEANEFTFFEKRYA